MLHSGKYKYADVETASAEYASRFAGETGEWLLSIQDRTLRKMLSEAGADAETALLDVGGGHGQLLRVAPEFGLYPTILASEAEGLRRLPESAAWKGITGDLLHSPLPDASFDLVVCIRLLSHCERWQALVAELCRLSSRFVIVEYPPLAGFNILYPIIFSLKKRSEGNTREFLSFSQTQVVSAFAEAGFALRSLEKQFALPMALHRKLMLPHFSAFLEDFFRACGISGLVGNPAIALFEKV